MFSSTLVPMALGTNSFILQVSHCLYLSGTNGQKDGSILAKVKCNCTTSKKANFHAQGFLSRICVMSALEIER